MWHPDFNPPNLPAVLQIKQTLDNQKLICIFDTLKFPNILLIEALTKNIIF